MKKKGTLTSEEQYQSQIQKLKKKNKKLEAELRMFKAIFDISSDMTCAKNNRAEFIYCNPKFADVLGASSAESMLHKSDKDYYSKEFAREALEEDKKVFKGMQVIEEEREREVEGKPLHLITTKVPLYDDNQKIIGLVSIAKDVTDWKNVENDKLKAEKSNQKLREKLELLTRESAQLRKSLNGDKAKETVKSIESDFSIFRFVRKKQGITIDELARRSKVSIAVISKLERNIGNPSLSTLKNIANSLNLSTAELISLTEPFAAKSYNATEYKSGQFTFIQTHLERFNYSIVIGRKGAELIDTKTKTNVVKTIGVIRGKLRVTLPQKIQILAQDESFQFDAYFAHTLEAIDDCELVIIETKKMKQI